jgi:hypothetical protein
MSGLQTNQYHHHHHHHHHWLDSPVWALAFFRSFRQSSLSIAAISAFASSDFVTTFFFQGGVAAPRPTPSNPGGSMFSVWVVSLSWLVPI